MPLSMLEQIALRFEAHASDQETNIRKYHGMWNAKDVATANVRAVIWRDAAKGLREIGANNRDEFLASIYNILASTLGKTHDKVATKIVAEFITPPIPAPTPVEIGGVRKLAEHKEAVSKLRPSRKVLGDEPVLAYKQETVEGVKPTAFVSPVNSEVSAYIDRVSITAEQRAGVFTPTLLELQLNMEGQPDVVIVNGIKYTQGPAPDTSLADEEVACECCGEHHPNGVVEDNLCPACTDVPEPTWPDDVYWIGITHLSSPYEHEISGCGRYERHRERTPMSGPGYAWIAGQPPK